MSTILHAFVERLPSRTLTAVWCLLLSIAAVRCCAADRPPNVIVLFVDDLGHGEIGACGGEFPTPHIDSLARDGVLCTNGFSACPLCSPSRAAMITGMYPQRFGVYGNTDRGQPIPKDHPTIAEFMRDAGYVTGMVGRWDLGSVGQGPLDRGFMEVARRPPRKPGPRPKPDGPTYLGNDGSYWTEVQGEELADFVTRHREEPFFLYYAPLAVHAPVEDVPDKYRERIDKSIPEPRRSLGGTLVALDDAIGRLLARLDELQLNDQTLIFFTGDNGGWLPAMARNAPYRGGKATAWEGGIHEPYFVRWTGQIPPGSTFPGLVSTLDVYATAAALTRREPPTQLDGVDILPFLKGQVSGEPHKHLFWHWESANTRYMKAVRRGNMRYMVDGDRGKTASEHLFDMSKDLGENQNLIGTQPELAAALAKELSTWEASLKPYEAHKALPRTEGPAGRGWAKSSDQRPQLRFKSR